MELDIKIAGGIVVDGTGAAGYAADVGIRDGRIVEIGKVTTPAARTIDADGALVTPGFVDMHTHYDVQATWDSELRASTRNGVTTAVMGNCGVGCAPLRPEDRGTIAALLSGVEDIPIPVLDVAVDWRWASFRDYLDRVDERAHAINLAANATHAPIRIHAMGERAGDGSAPTETDIATMQELLAEALDAGAAGFSTGRIGPHQMDGGAHTPDYFAPPEEVLALARTVARYPGRPIQFSSDYGLGRGEAATVTELDLIRGIAALGMPVSTGISQLNSIEGGWRRTTAELAEMNAAGANIMFETSARAIGAMMGLEVSVHPFIRHPAYREIEAMPIEARVRRMREPEVRARILREEPALTMPHDRRMKRMLDQMTVEAFRVFACDAMPDYEPAPEVSIEATARRNGWTVAEAYYDALTEGDGRRLLYFPFSNFNGGNLDEQHAILSKPNTMFSFGDAGAHLAQICDAAYSSFSLAYWGRDRPVGMTIERLVHQMTGMQARHFGFAGRGVIALGAHADVNVIDHAALRLEPPILTHDLPGGGKRLLQDATGYLATLVAGVPILERDAMTGALPGRVVRFT